jgi:putative ABC transport system permease protein
VLTVDVDLPPSRYATGNRQTQFFDALIERVGALPGVQSVGGVQQLPLSGPQESSDFRIMGAPPPRPGEEPEVAYASATPGYFSAMSLTLRRGRLLADADGTTAPRVAVINETMARRFWPNEDPVGKRFCYGGPQCGGPLLTIVGVVGDMRRTGFDKPVRYETFLPYTQLAPGTLTLVVRTIGDPLAAVAPVRAQLRSLDAEQPLFEVATMDQLLSSMVAQRRFSMTLLGTFAALALLLGVVGVYGVTSYLVAQRTREVGVRLALGAPPGQVVAMVVRQGMTVAVVGLGIGLVAALAAARLMAGLLFGVSPYDVATLLVVIAVIALATLIANWVPALRAAHVDPLSALRSD